MRNPFVTSVLFLIAAARTQPASAATQTVTFDKIPNQILGVSPFPVAAQSSSLLPVTFTSTTPPFASWRAIWSPSSLPEPARSQPASPATGLTARPRRWFAASRSPW